MKLISKQDPRKSSALWLSEAEALVGADGGEKVGEATARAVIALVYEQKKTNELLGHLVSLNPW